MSLQEESICLKKNKQTPKPKNSCVHSRLDIFSLGKVNTSFLILAANRNH